jgi:DNA-binding transcriptional ArsR family regulator
MSGEDLREVMEALSERTRYSILEALSKKPMTGDEIAEAVQRSRSTVESHLSTFLRLGLVTRRRDDKKYYYEATPTAQMWLGRMAASKGVSTLQAEKTSPKGRTFYLSWFFAPILLGAAYVVINALIPVPIWLFALLFGVVSVWFCKTLMGLMESLLVASITMTVLIGLFRFYSVLDLGLSFVISLAFLVVLGIPVWLLTKKVLGHSSHA